MGKLVLGCLFIICLLFVYRRTYFYDEKWLHYPPPEPINTGNNQSNSLSQGHYQQTPILSTYEKLSRKKINNYFLMIDDKHKVEMAVVDLGYIRSISVSYFSENRAYHFDEEGISFSLSENLAEPLNISHSNFSLIQEKTSTQLYLHLEQPNGLFSVSLTYIQPPQGCITYLRNKVISYKCYAGSVQGVLRINSPQDNFSLKLLLTTDNTLGGFDGLRGSGWQWKWTWGMGQTKRENQIISINLGSIEGIGEDVFQVSGKAIPIKGIQYALSKNFTLGDSFIVKSTEPQLNLEFKVTVRDHRYRDLGILKLDLLRFEGYWSGSFFDPNTQQQKHLAPFPGIVEVGDNIF